MNILLNKRNYLKYEISIENRNNISHLSRLLNLMYKNVSYLEKNFRSFIFIKVKSSEGNLYKPHYPLKISLHEIKTPFKKYKKDQIIKYFSNSSIGDISSILKTNIKRKVGIITGETGISPVLQFLNFFFKKKSRVRVDLIFTNGNINQIPLLEKLQTIIRQNYHFKVNFLLENKEGIVNKQIIISNIGNPEIGKIVLVCGPIKMNLLVFKILHDLGFSKYNIIKL
jgi:NAD(P)H-flavin reductase